MHSISEFETRSDEIFMRHKKAVQEFDNGVVVSTGYRRLVVLSC